MSEPTLWGMHAGRTGDADYLFLKKKFLGNDNLVGSLANSSNTANTGTGHSPECALDWT